MLGLDGQEAVKHQCVWYKNNERNNRTRSKWHGVFCQSIRALGKEPVQVYLWWEFNGLITMP
jgi:hypothetical protein